MTAREAAAVQERVLGFYRELAFNRHASVEQQVRDIETHDPLAAYPVLRPLVRRGERVLEVGCGTGWLSNGLAHHHGAQVTGIDLNGDAVEFARRAATHLRLSTRLQCADLFTYEPDAPFPLVVSLGVLHHTHDCAAALARVCTALLAPGGHVLIGLYHRFGRQPFLEHFQRLRQRGASEAELLQRYRELHPQVTDDIHALSWFRDQVLHPHETQHTLAEMDGPLRASGCAVIATSLNGFAPLTGGLAEVFRREPDQARAGRERLAEGRFDPGFFLFLARKVT